MALPSEALLKSRKSLSLHFRYPFVKGIDDKNETYEEDEDFELLLVDEETGFSSDSYMMSETLNGDKDLLPLRPEEGTLSLPRFCCCCCCGVGSSSLVRVSSNAIAKGSKSFFLLWRGEKILFPCEVLGDLGDDALVAGEVIPSPECNRGGGFKGLIFPPSKSSSAEREAGCSR